MHYAFCLSWNKYSYFLFLCQMAVWKEATCNKIYHNVWDRTLEFPDLIFYIIKNFITKKSLYYNTVVSKRSILDITTIQYLYKHIFFGILNSRLAHSPHKDAIVSQSLRIQMMLQKASTDNDVRILIFMYYCKFSRSLVTEYFHEIFCHWDLWY